MVKRSEAMAFAAGALVFPGGRIDEQDRALSGGDAEFGSRLGAIRECLEETAVAAALHPLPDAERSRSIQKDLLAGAAFSDLLTREQLELDSAALIPFARWIPKVHASRRFDTIFFIAKAPENAPEPYIVEGECESGLWLSAAEALDLEARGEARLLFPTRRNLERLALHSTFEAMLADCFAHPVEPIIPTVETIGGEDFITIPEGIGYPVTRERLEGLWRG
jgi:8-oxo-dGTP pyrophosphatase MutT (NUDIX family)